MQVCRVYDLAMLHHIFFFCRLLPELFSTRQSWKDNLTKGDNPAENYKQTKRERDRIMSRPGRLLPNDREAIG